MLRVTLSAAIVASMVASLVCFVRADNSPRSESARLLMEEEEEEDTRYYFPEGELLSDRGRALRSRGWFFLKVAGGVFLALWIVVMAGLK